VSLDAPSRQSPVWSRNYSRKEHNCRRSSGEVNHYCTKFSLISARATPNLAAFPVFLHSSSCDRSVCNCANANAYNIARTIGAYCRRGSVNGVSL
jgi:hypothetical protein